MLVAAHSLQSFGNGQFTNGNICELHQAQRRCWDTELKKSSLFSPRRHVLRYLREEQAVKNNYYE